MDDELNLWVTICGKRKLAAQKAIDSSKTISPAVDSLRQKQQQRTVQI